MLRYWVILPAVMTVGCGSTDFETGTAGVGGDGSGGAGGALARNAGEPGKSRPPAFCVAQPSVNTAVDAVTSEEYWVWFMAHLENVGSQITRISGPTLGWEVVEPVLGGGYDFTLADDFIDRIANGAGKIELVMTINPTIGGRDPLASPTEYAAFLTAVFDRYAPGGGNLYNSDLTASYFQVGNEPQDVPPAAEYTDLLELTVQVARGSTAEVELLGVAANETFYDIVIPEIASRGLDDRVVGIDVHSWNRDRLDRFLMSVSSLREILDQNGLEHLSIWSLENGTYYGCPNNFDGSPRLELTERDQALFLVEAIATSRLAGLDVYCWNNLVDWQAFDGDPNSIFSAMGLIGDGQGNDCEDPSQVAQPRIAYHSFQRLSSALGRPQVIAGRSVELNSGSAAVSGVVFESGSAGPRTYVLWSESGGEATVDLAVATSEVRVIPLITDLNGDDDAWSAPSDGGLVNLTIDGAALVVEEAWQ